MLKIECCGLTSTQTRQIIEKQFAGQVEPLTDPDMVAARSVKKGDVDFWAPAKPVAADLMPPISWSWVTVTV